jgi:ABC-2 type transport system ATP-binding protein
VSILEFRDLRRSYQRGEEVLSGVTFAIEEGQVVGLLGRNGAGKTTLINIAMGMIRAQGGSVRVFGLDPQQQPVEIKRRVGFVSEQQILPPHMRVEAVIRFHRELFPTWDADLEKALRQRFDVDPRTRVKSLSRGQARQLALLCAVAHRPELLILDEPAGGLDPAARREFLETAIQLLSESGTTILFSSHYMSDVERMADRIVLLHDRDVLIDAELDDLRENHLLAVLPDDGNIDVDKLATVPGCLRVRRHHNALHAVFAGRPDEVCALLEAELGTTEAVCRHVPLEDLFVELLGASS